LIYRVCSEALRIGIDTLYLFTPNAEVYYNNLGWQRIAVENYRDTSVTIMKKTLNK